MYEAFDLELNARVALRTNTVEDLVPMHAQCSDFEREVRLGAQGNASGNMLGFLILDTTKSRATTEAVGTNRILHYVVDRGRNTTRPHSIGGGASRQTKLGQLIEGMVEALAAAHEAGVIHRDFKPSNVMISARTTAGVRSTGDAEPCRRGVDFGIDRAGCRCP